MSDRDLLFVIVFIAAKVDFEKGGENSPTKKTTAKVWNVRVC